MKFLNLSCAHIAGIELLNGFPKLQLRAPEANHNIVESSNHGSCKICLCNSYQAVETKPAAPLPDADDLVQN